MEIIKKFKMEGEEYKVTHTFLKLINRREGLTRFITLFHGKNDVNARSEALLGKNTHFVGRQIG